MPRAKKTSDSNTKRKSSGATNAPAIQSDVHPETISVKPATEEQIRRRAYELFLQRGGFWGSPDQDWFQAEAEVRDHHVS
jgi:hypothetical protein